jgi:hypothetical protein
LVTSEDDPAQASSPEPAAARLSLDEVIVDAINDLEALYRGLDAHPERLIACNRELSHAPDDPHTPAIRITVLVRPAPDGGAS